MITLITCTFLGYAIGFGAGVGAATVFYLLYGILDTVRLSAALPLTIHSLTKETESPAGRYGSRR